MEITYVPDTARTRGKYQHTSNCDACPLSPNCDVVYDEKIDMRDVGIVARHAFETDL